MKRRGLLLGILGLTTAPSIVRASSIMRIDTRIVAVDPLASLMARKGRSTSTDFWAYPENYDGRIGDMLIDAKLRALGISPEILNGDSRHYSTVYEAMKHYA
jgi:hypothetical protein